jgi:hypothetical protein
MFESIVKQEKDKQKKRAGTEHTTNQETGSKIITRDASIIGLFIEIKSVYSSFFKNN